MKDARSGGAPNIARLLANWNAQPDAVRYRKLGIKKGIPYNSFVARSRLPFKLPPGAKVEEDGSISRGR